jgi:osmotically-inducible protein OsmY
MNLNSTTKPEKTLRLALAGALLLGLAACDGKTQSGSPTKSFDNLVENAGRNVTVPAQSASSEAGMTRPQSSSPATDLVLEARVKAALSADPGLRSVTVDVKSADGVVTLYGTADSPAKSHQAAMVALNVDGVRSVRNEMVIVRGS